MNPTDQIGFDRTLRHALAAEMLIRLRPTVIHSLKGPTQTILSALHMLVKSIDAPVTAETPANRQRYLEWIRNAVTSLSILAEKIIPQELDGSAEAQVFDLGTLTADSVYLLRDEAALRSIEFNLEKPEQPANVRGRQQELKLAVQTLLAGAVDRAPTEAALNIAVARSGDRIEWSIAVPPKAGTAPPDMQAFETHFEVEPPASAIGWYVARSILTEHGGDVGIEDRGGDGWSLKFSLRAY